MRIQELLLSGMALSMLFLLACSSEQAPSAEARFSLLAVGDTGLAPDSHDGQYRVADMMTAEDMEHPVDAILLLGDNFYPDGLAKAELATRIRHNVIDPYCRFVDLGPRATEIQSHCQNPGGHGRPLWAILGNHDYGLPESPRLQQEVVPAFVANWKMNRDVVEVFEAAPGLQLILVDSERLLQQDPRPLQAAIAQAAGPWRIIATHHPLVAGTGEDDGLLEAIDALQRVFSQTQHRVQLVISGHEHNLQAYRPSDGGPALHVIAGGGATGRKVKPAPESRVFAKETRGFARVRLLEDREELLHVELIATPKARFGMSPRRKRVAHFLLNAQGQFISASHGPSIPVRPDASSASR